MDFLPNIVYQDDDLLLARKPYGIASSWGQEVCFLDMIKKCGSDTGSASSDKGQASSPATVWSEQISIFGEEGEYGLLNRLDTVTAGLLYFARSYEAKAEYMHLQEQGLIHKTYYAKVYGIPRAQFGRITTPIYHHLDDASRMTTDPKKGRGKGQKVTTYWEMVKSQKPKVDSAITVSNDQGLATRNNSILKITIICGCRHQIRCHLASIGHPIVGDRLYMSKKQRGKMGRISEIEKIELVSAGLEILNY